MELQMHRSAGWIVRPDPIVWLVCVGSPQWFIQNTSNVMLMKKYVSFLIFSIMLIYLMNSWKMFLKELYKCQAETWNKTIQWDKNLRFRVNRRFWHIKKSHILRSIALPCRSHTGSAKRWFFWQNSSTAFLQPENCVLYTSWIRRTPPVERRS